ncbi:MAG: HAD family hydrolase [Fimbriimonadaceae bacterium]
MKTVFSDVGGVILTNGWDRKARRDAAEQFCLDLAELDERHHLTFDSYERGQIDLQEYLYRTVFYEPRPFTEDQYRTFMFDRSKPLEPTLSGYWALRDRYSFRLAAISNEGKDLAQHRIDKFELAKLFDSVLFSGFVGLRKPDVAIFKLALHVSLAKPEDSIYVDDRLMFVQIARSYGLRGIHHVDPMTTLTALDEFLSKD